MNHMLRNKQPESKLIFLIINHNFHGNLTISYDLHNHSFGIKLMYFNIFDKYCILKISYDSSVKTFHFPNKLLLWNITFSRLYHSLHHQLLLQSQLQQHDPISSLCKSLRNLYKYFSVSTCNRYILHHDVH